MSNEKTKSETTALELARYEAQYRADAILEQAVKAIASMENFLSDAKREIDRAREEPHRKEFGGGVAVASLPNRVLHALTWGSANASGYIESANRDAQALVLALARVEAAEAK